MLSDSVVEVTPQALQKIGADLFDSVFNGDIKILYHKSIKQAKDLGRNLRVNFRNDLSNLSSTPWEIMFDKQKMNFISCNEIAPFTRSGPWDEIIIQRQRPINILLIIAKPKSMNGTTLDHINADLEENLIGKAFGRLDGETIKLYRTTSSSVREISRRLDVPPRGGGSWDVIHFIGHGGYDQGREQGYIVVQEDGGTGGEPLFAVTLNALLGRWKTPQLVVLNSCSGAQSKPGDLFSSTATTLISGDIPAVIAMSSEISDDASCAFSDLFYDHLSSNYSVHKALTKTRIILQQKFPIEWCIPVLYLRGDGALLEGAASANSAAGGN